MTYQLCKLRMKSLLFDVDCILWTLVLPIVLGLLFFFVMGKVDKFEEFQSIPIGIVDDMGKDGGCFRAFSSAKTEEGNEIFDVECIGLIDAQEKFEKEDISGYIVVDDGYRLYIQKDDSHIATIIFFISYSSSSPKFLSDFLEVSTSQRNHFYSI